MKFTATALPDVVLIEPRVHGDERGFFMEIYQRAVFAEAGIDVEFVQDNVSRSRRGTLRGLHFQVRHTQGKLVRVVAGEVFDVAVDVRRSSQTFGKWAGARLSSENKRSLWVPPGFAHGFLVLSESADFHYKCTEYYDAESERALRWDDESIAIDWPIPAGVELLLSPRDATAPRWGEVETLP